jgi:hypothetical protein
MIITAPNAFALSPAEADAAWKPAIGWRNFITSANLTATTADASYPVTNLLNPATNQFWQAGSLATQYLTSTGLTQATDYVGLARHNFGTGGIIVSVEEQVGSGDAWSQVWAEYLPADDRVIMARFAKSVRYGLRVKLQPTAVKPRLARLAMGPLIILPYGIPPGYVPINFATRTEKQTGVAQNGDYLGSVSLTRGLSSALQQKRLDPDWYREEFEPFRLGIIDDDTFFFAWAPQDHPDEVGYCWVNGDPQPSAGMLGEMDIALAIEGLAV